MRASLPRATFQLHSAFRTPHSALRISFLLMPVQAIAWTRSGAVRIGEAGLPLVPDGAAVLTHCNAGALATGGIGTALAPVYLAHEAGRRVHVYVDETRPVLQGARLTAWELAHAGIRCTVVADAAAG